MYLEFEEILINHFKAFTSTPVRFPLTGKRAGVRFIRGRNEAEPALGSNGASKSSIADAFLWCLCGVTVEGLRTPDVTPWVGGSPGVSVRFRVDDKPHTVSRLTDPNRVLIDGKEADQDAVDQIIRLPLEVIKNAVILGQGQGLFFDLTPKNKMDVFSAALNLERWEERAQTASEAVKVIEAELSQLEAKYNQTNNTADGLERAVKSVRAASEEWHTKNLKERKDLEAELKVAEKELTLIEKRQGNADLIYDGATAELAAINKGLGALVKARDEAQNEWNKAELVVTGLKQELSRSIKGDTCPSCGQSLKGSAYFTHRADLTRRLAEAQDKLKTGRGGHLASSLKKAVLALAAANDSAEKFRDKAADAQSTLNNVNLEAGRLRGRYDELKQRFRAAEDRPNPHRATIENMTRQIRDLDRKLDTIEADIKRTKEDLAHTVPWVKGFKDVRLQLLEELMQELELATNSLLPESGLLKWKVLYSLEKETKKGTIQQGINVSILSPKNKTAVKWQAFSGGERNRLRLVGALALAEVLLRHAEVETNLEIIDEPTRDLSIEGVQDLCEYLAARAERLDKDTFFIDHMAVESSHFVDVLTVVKTDKGAHLELG